MRRQNSDRTGPLPFFLKSLQSLLVFYFTGDNYHSVRTGQLWGLAVVRGAILSQVNDPAVSYRWTEEVFTQKNKSHKVNLLLFRR